MNDKIELAVLLSVNNSVVHACDDVRATSSQDPILMGDGTRSGIKTRHTEGLDYRTSGAENIDRFCPTGTSITVENAKRLRSLSGWVTSFRSRKMRTGMLDFTRYA